MNINRDNYESWFLLYIDTELSAEEMQEVEAFAATHPDLKAELDLLLDTRLIDDTPVVFDKSSLLRSEYAAINSGNCEEQFLLYVDDELDTRDKAAVETFVLQHPEKQDAFTLLKQTKLQPEQISFPDKASLYREEKTVRPVIYMQWRRIAVAAALIGMAVLVWTIAPQDQTTQSSFAGTTVPVPSGNNATQRSADASSSATNQVIAEEQTFAANNTNSQSNQQQQIRFANEVAEKNTTLPVTNDLLNRQEDVIASVTDDSKTGTQANINNTINTTATITMDPVMVAAKAEDNPANKNNMMQQAVYRELDTDDDRKTLYLGAVEINKDKLRGIFRKASSLFKSKVKQAEAEEEENNASTVNSSPTRSSLD
ncbi:MAG: hypothetical protein K2Y12_02275 [Chitinophagaceae bacterium]|nr:hypothetical protein [Chitinophagaceae bacterium]